MSEGNQKEILQSIVSEVVEVLPEGWLEVILSYQVEGDQSQFANSFTLVENGKLIEKSVPAINGLDLIFRQLRDHLARDKREPFSKCNLHYKSSGEFESKYGYEPIDWEELPGWNFDVNG